MEWNIFVSAVNSDGTIEFVAGIVGKLLFKRVESNKIGISFVKY